MLFKQKQSMVQNTCTVHEMEWQFVQKWAGTQNESSITRIRTDWPDSSYVRGNNGTRSAKKKSEIRDTASKSASNALIIQAMHQTHKSYDYISSFDDWFGGRQRNLSVGRSWTWNEQQFLRFSSARATGTAVHVPLTFLLGFMTVIQEWRILKLKFIWKKSHQVCSHLWHPSLGSECVRGLRDAINFCRRSLTKTKHKYGEVLSKPTPAKTMDCRRSRNCARCHR